MTLIKSLLLGSAAGIVAVASAQAADLPTRKGPVAAEYVRVCSITVAGAPVVGFVLPGSDTCLKISGYITGQIEGGSLKTGYYTNISGQNRRAFAPDGSNSSIQHIAGTFGADSFGWTTRYNLTVDAVSNTAYGPLVSHAEVQTEAGNNFATDGNSSYVNRAYVTWAGITAGKANSFFSFTGGGLGWNNFFSPDEQGFNEPDVLAYTASFGGGFSATLALQSTGPLGGSGGGIIQGYLGSATQGGLRVPDIVGALDVKQSWGTAHLGGLGHEVRAISTQGDGSTLDKWGFAIDAGVSFNLPIGTATTMGVTGAYARNATWYSGIPDGLWGDAGQAINGNGQGMTLGDAFSNGDGTWATPTAWSVTAYAQTSISPTVTLGLEGSYGELSWSGQSAVSLLSTSKSFLVGAVGHYDPVKNLDFELEIFYQSTITDQPTGYIPSAVGTAAWQNKSDGFTGRLEVTRSF
jgi:hypothetical protein